VIFGRVMSLLTILWATIRCVPNPAA